MDVSVLLADWADAINGKLYIQGGGWSQTMEGPVRMAVAMNFLVEWGETNRQFRIALRLLDEDGNTAEPEPGRPFVIEALLEAGRPPGTRPGTPISAPMAFNFLLPLTAGRYTLQVEADGVPIGRGVSFTVLPSVGGG